MQNRLGSREIALEEQRRGRKDVADVVEAVADVVAGKISSGLKIDADQIADRVVVFDAVQAADGHTADIGGLRAIKIREDAFDGLNDGFDIGGGRTFPLHGRHFASAEHVQDVVPDFAILLDRQVVGVIAEG